VEPEDFQLPILEVISRVRSGKAEVRELLDACDAIREDLTNMSQGFEEQLLAEHEEIRPALAPEVEATQKSFDLYFRVLDSLTSYATDFEKERLDDAEVHIPAAISRLSLDFLRFREAALAQRGPTTHPGINLLVSLVRSQAEQQTLDEAIEQEINRAHNWLDQDLEPSNLGPELQAFYASYLEQLQEAPEDREAWVNSLTELGKHFTRLDVDSIRRRFAYGPSVLPWLNLVVHSSWLATQNSVSSELVRDLASEAAVEIERILAGLTGWEVADDWTHQAGQLLQEMLAWLDDTLAWLELCEHQTQQALSERGLELAERYRPLIAKVDNRMEDQAPRCELCGNLVQGDKCATCGARVHATTLNPDEKPPENRIDEIIGQAEMILREAGSRSVFGSLLDALQNDFRSACSKDPGENVSPELREFRARYVESLEILAEALEQLEDFRQQPSQEALDAAEEPLRQSFEELMELQQEFMAGA